jgi:hypothetical protein
MVSTNFAWPAYVWDLAQSVMMTNLWQILIDILNQTFNLHSQQLWNEMITLPNPQIEIAQIKIVDTFSYMYRIYLIILTILEDL